MRTQKRHKKVPTEYGYCGWSGGHLELFSHLEVQNRSPLRVVERGGAVEEPHEEEGGGAAGHGLQAQAPTEGPGRRQSSYTQLFYYMLYSVHLE